MQQTAHFPLQGGLDLVTPPLAMPPGRMIAGENYEPHPAGYRRIDGYERFDGRPAPSDAPTDERAQEARAAILPLPGSGPVRGVTVYRDRVYAFRDNAAGDACIMHKATDEGWQAVDTGEVRLQSGGRFSFVIYNFSGHEAGEYLYWCDGINPAIMFDGSVLTPIETGMENDAPTAIAAHANHLFLAFPGGSLQHSGLGDPTLWAVAEGAAEIGLGEDITALLPMVGVLAIFGRNRAAILYGTSAADWQIKTLSDEAGALTGTAQYIGTAIYLDDRGVRSLSTTQNYGDFKKGTLSQPVDPLFGKLRGHAPTSSLRVREKDQYRIYWDNGAGVVMYLGRKRPEFMVFKLPVTVRTATSAEMYGAEIMLAGADDGYVYRLDRGNDFDGAPIPAWCRLAFSHQGKPMRVKRYHKAAIDIETYARTRIGLVAEFGYGDPGQPPASETMEIVGGGGFWEEADWDNFHWSVPVEGVAETHIAGLGRNISLCVVSHEAGEEAHILHGVTINYSERGAVR